MNNLKAILFTVLASVSFAAAAGSDGAKFNVNVADNGAKFITGGVGNTEAAAMERRFGNYSLKLVNVRERGEAAYVANVDVKIINNQGETLLETTTDGPWLIADLEQGNYTVWAQFQGQEQKFDIVIGSENRERRVLQWQTDGELVPS